MFNQFRFVIVVALLGIAAALLTDRTRLPLALRGLKRVLGKDAGLSPQTDRKRSVSPLRRLLAFALVLAAFVVAVL
ncbi:MAG: hypothetical protein ACI4Q3_03665 [Kiritimatiellia bacterium]